MLKLLWEPYLDVVVPAPELRLRHTEQALGVRFPDDVRAILREHQGQTVEPNVFVVGSGNDVFNCLLHVMDDGPYVEYGILQTYNALSHLLPPGVYPIADTPGGNNICLDYRADPNQPTVVHWDHELDPAVAITPVAASFSEFLSHLYE